MIDFSQFKAVLPEDEIDQTGAVIKELVRKLRQTKKSAEEEIASFEERVEEEIGGRFSPIEDENGSRMETFGWHDGNYGDNISQEEMEERKAEYVRNHWCFDEYTGNIAKVAVCDEIIRKLTSKKW